MRALMHGNGHGLFQLNVWHSPSISYPLYKVHISMVYSNNLDSDHGNLLNVKQSDITYAIILKGTARYLHGTLLT